MVMWERPAGPAGGDDIALTTPVSAAEGRRHLPDVRGCAGAGHDRPLRDLLRRNRPRSALRWERSRGSVTRIVRPQTPSLLSLRATMPYPTAVRG